MFSWKFDSETNGILLTPGRPSATARFRRSGMKNCKPLSGIKSTSPKAKRRSAGIIGEDTITVGKSSRADAKQRANCLPIRENCSP